MALSLLTLAALHGVILAMAGRWNFWQGWVFSSINVLSVVIASFFFRRKIDLLKERLRPGPGVKWWDKAFWAIYAPLLIAMLAAACLDAGRRYWGPSAPTPAVIAGVAIYAASNALMLWAMWCNNWFSTVMRLQLDREQRVVDSGPYRIVRHPGYAAAILQAPGAALALGSIRALAPAGAIVLLLIARTAMEDRTLRRELAGYDEFTRQTRYRLAPGVW